MDFAKKNDFVVKHTTDKYFDKDLLLYKKCFPTSDIIPHLEVANQFNKKDLDGRMLLEMLDVVCGETILENRGIVKDANMEEVPIKAGESNHLKALKKEAIAKQNYKVLRRMANNLELKTPNQKKATLINTLTKVWEELNATPPSSEPEPKDKKKEDPG